MKSRSDPKAPYKKFRRAMAKEFCCPPAVIDKAVKRGVAMFMEAHKAGDPLAVTMSRVFLPIYLVGFQYWLVQEQVRIENERRSRSGSSPVRT